MQLQIRLTLIATGPLLVFPTMVWAQQNIGDVAGRLNSQIGDIGTLLGAVATVIGVGMLIMSGVKFRAYSTNPQDPNASLGGSIGWLLAGSELGAIPTFLDVGVATLFDGGTQGALDGSNLGLGN